MFRMIMDFDRSEMRIPKDVAQALSMPVDFGWFVHRGDRKIAITQNLGYVPRNSQIDRYWRETVGAYCIAVKNGMQQTIGNLISGFNGSGVYIMTGKLEHAFGELAVVFDLAHAAAVTNVEKEEDNVSVAAPEPLSGCVKTYEGGMMPKQNPCKWCGKELPPSRTKTIHFCNGHCYNLWWHANREKRKAYHRTCLTCGKEFTVYSKKQQKYCSPACFYAERRGESLCTR